MNVCKVSNVSQLVKPSTVSKPVLSNNVRNVLKVNSISQLVKTFNVTKTVCSSNAINSGICISTCKPVSNFFSDCQSFKPACKLIDVNWNVLKMDLLIIRKVTNMILQNHLVL